MSIDAGYETRPEGVNSEHQSKRRKENSARKKLAYRDYAVGWVAALSEEHAAARAMLDELHQELPQKEGDSNIYTLGRIGDHNIVIAGLPSDGYGTVNAATVGKDMHRTFPSLRDYLMVGVAGGAGKAGKFDVRLGDIVVGDKLVQYDLKKDLSPHYFETTAVPLRPSQRLRIAVAKLKSVHEAEESEVPTYIREIANNNPKMKRYSIRPSLQDLLFEDTYEHTEPNEICDTCDRSKLVERQRREHDGPEIHYGVIASGNSLIKSPEKRNQLVEQFKALCFEMEGAGIIESLQCLVIRSICDYADSHKNKLWQPYAAAAAAAYAKELILAIPTSENQESKLVRDELLFGEIKALQDSLSFGSILFREHSIQSPHGDTCKWIFRHSTYLTWLDPKERPRHNGFLWIRGKPGAGKSTLMKLIYTSLKSKFNAISFFFNARGDLLEKSSQGMYRSLLLQILQQLPTSQQEQLFRHHPLLRSIKPGCIKWDNGTLQELLSKAISQFVQGELMCLVDALDECGEDEVYDIVEYFEKLGKLASEAKVSLFICLSSRHYPSISVRDGITLMLEDQSGHRKDLGEYVNDKLHVDSVNAEIIRNTLIRKAAGVFMWVVLVVTILNKEYQSGRIFAVKKRLNVIPDELNELFKDMLKRDNNNMDEFLLSIQWILYAREPLKPQEYYYALQAGLDYEQGDLGEWDRQEVTIQNMEQYVLTSSKGLAEVTKGWHPIVQFIHESVRDFLLKDGGINEIWPSLECDFQSYSHNVLKRCCYAYIGARVSDTSVPTQDQIISSSFLRRFPFTTIAIRDVAYHSRAASVKLSQQDFLESFDFTTWTALCNPCSDQLTAYEVCESLFSLLTSQIPDDCSIRGTAQKSTHYHKLPPVLDCPFYHGWTPLGLASRENHGDLIRVLLDRGVDVNGRDIHDRTPLFYATLYGRQWEAIRRVLLRTLDRTNAEDDTKILELLLSRGANVNIADKSGETPLHAAVTCGHTSHVQLFLDHGAQVDAPARNSMTPLHLAAMKRHDEIIELLLNKGAHVNTPNKLDGRTPLHIAIDGGKPLPKKPSPNYGTRVNQFGYNDRIPFHIAVNGKESAASRLLFEHGGWMNAPDGDNIMTPPQQLATINKVVKILLGRGAQINTPNHTGKTALHIAAIFGYKKLTEMLVSYGAKTGISDNDSKTPLQLAVENGHSKIVELLQPLTRADKKT
ncbi:hypothetical protein RRF57_011467 [Xylaria bambusicola]|uniref:Nucleoside phosphorylase domain-containing protein n=1 Tax=Xylaria bambusicola TaxID=326684 RepID=A0AAN7UMX2_9PEZI